MQYTRRHFIHATAATALGFAGLRQFIHGPASAFAQQRDPARSPFGPLTKDPYGIFDLPDGFSYHVISKRGERMDDGLFVPGNHDGMAAFQGPNGSTIIIRNHELTAEPARDGEFGYTHELLPRMDPAMFYDAGHGRRPLLGGTTTLIYDTTHQRLEKHFLSLAGTGRNCAGSPTPWNSWITCEEWTQQADDQHEKTHGYNFEVPASATGLVPPVPLKDMGRFNHEAIAVDPNTGFVYETEDRNDSQIYRFIPHQPGQLHRGGRLQALSIRDHKSLDTRNWLDDEGKPITTSPIIEVGQTMDVTWIDLDDVESPRDDLRHRGFEQGAARFARGEGMWYGHDSIFFACTSGGKKHLGQIWRYTPTPGDDNAGKLELFIEPNDGSLIENADNLTVSPWGDLFVCEDGPDENRLLRVTPSGNVHPFGHNRISHSELAGATFSPDGSTLFINIQQNGLTLAITGPWPQT